MAKTKFSIWRYIICEICKKNGSNRPFLASRVADTIFPPPIEGHHRQLDNQCKDPMDNNKDCRVGQLTRQGQAGSKAADQCTYCIYQYTASSEVSQMYSSFISMIVIMIIIIVQCCHAVSLWLSSNGFPQLERPRSVTFILRRHCSPVLTIYAARPSLINILSQLAPLTLFALL